MNIEDLKSCGNCDQISLCLGKFRCYNKKSNRYKEDFQYLDKCCDEWNYDKLTAEERKK